MHTRILTGLMVGAGAGLAANAALGGEDRRIAWVIANLTNPVGQLFLRLLLMIVAPLVFSSLVVGAANMGNIRTLGRVGLKSLAYTLALSAISVGIALGFANAVRPGERMDPATSRRIEERYASEAASRVTAVQETAGGGSPLLTVVRTLAPSNPFAAAAADPPNMLHLMFFALLLGIAATLVPQETAGPVIGFLEALFAISAKVIDVVMKLAPYAVACLLFNNTASFGLDVLRALAWFMLTVVGGLALHMFGVYSLAVKLLAGISPFEFFRRVKTVMATAFATSSSNATLPTALKAGEQNLGVPREINSFVLTLGATANQNGTALYEGVTVLFLAQLAGVELTLGQQMVVAYMAILGGIGTAGVPAGSIPFIVVVLTTVGVNPALIALILGVDRILDMCRTTLNVVGDLTAAAYVARSEGHRLLGAATERAQSA